MSNVPKINWTNEGPQLPTETEILQGVQADIDTAFGGGVNPQLSTPQGQIAQSNTAIIGDKNAEMAYIANMVNPDFATGRWQDAIGRIYFIDRQPGAGTVVNCVCNGKVNTLIPAGSLVQDNNGYIYQSATDGIIPRSGRITIAFQNQEQGAIACPANTVRTIVQAKIGWDTVNNPEAGIIGRFAENRADFEFRRQNTVAVVGLNSVDAILGNVLSQPDVIDCYVIDNPKNEAVKVGITQYELKPHSVYVAVVGGHAKDIAYAIWNKKSAGCDYNGNTNFDITDDKYPDPKPTYTITWQTPKATPIFFTVNIVDNGTLPSNITEQIKNVIIAHFLGQDGSGKARIGSIIYASSYYGVITSIDSSVNIQTIFVGNSENPTKTSTELGIDQSPTISEDNIIVNIIKI